MADFSKIKVEKKINKSKNNDGYDVFDISRAYNLDYIEKPYKNIHNYIDNYIDKNIKIVIIIAYSNPKLQENFDNFCKINNLPPKKINIIKINPNTPSNTDWNTEICIDTQWSYGIFPYSDIYVVEAETDSVSDLLVAIEIGKNLNPDIINMSWGVDEFENCNQIDIFDNCGIIFVSSSGDDTIVQWPSSNPNVLAIGATSLYVKNNKEYFYETTWNNTGCGYSKYFLTPKYQFVSNA
jgi:subtilase family serine protease